MNRATVDNYFLKYSLVCLVFILTYLFSSWILEYYTGGDQRYYTSLYDTMSKIPFNYQNINYEQFRHTGSREPLYGILMWLLSALMEKNVAISLINSVFLSSLFVFLWNNKAHPIFIILIFTNYYIFVLLTAAERLKFGYLFAVFVALLPKPWRIFSFLASLLNHFSLLIVFVALLLPGRYQDTLRSFRKGGLASAKSIIALFLTSATFMTFCYIYKDKLLEKVEQYNSSGITSLIPAIILFILSLIVARDKVIMALSLLFPLIATLFLGGDRVNMLTATVFLYVVIKERQTNNPIVTAIMLYLSFKTIGYMHNIFSYGTGFIT